MPRKPSQSPVEHRRDIEANQMRRRVIATDNASCGAPDDGPATVAHDSSALLGLEPADTEKAGENSPVEVEATRSPPLAPLLGTIFRPDPGAVVMAWSRRDRTAPFMPFYH